MPFLVMFLHMVTSLHNDTTHNLYNRNKFLMKIHRETNTTVKMMNLLSSRGRNLPVLWVAAVGNIHILDGLSEHKRTEPEETNQNQKDQRIWGVHTGHHFVHPAHICAGRVRISTNKTHMISPWKLATTSSVPNYRSFWLF